MGSLLGFPSRRSKDKGPVAWPPPGPLQPRLGTCGGYLRPRPACTGVSGYREWEVREREAN